MLVSPWMETAPIDQRKNSIQVQPGEPVSLLGLCIALWVTWATKKSHSWCLGSYTSEESPGVAQDYTGRDPTQSINFNLWITSRSRGL